MNIFEDEIEKANEAEKENVETTVEAPVSQNNSELQDELANIESLIAMNPEIKDSEEYKELMGKIEGEKPAEVAVEKEEEEEDKPVEEEEESTEEEEINDVFGVTIKDAKKEKESIKFETPEGMSELLSSKYGVQDTDKFFSSVDTWRTQAQEGAEYKSKLSNLENDIQDLPPEIRESIVNWSNGDDYKAPFTNEERLDFTNDFNEQYVDSLVEHYLPEQFSDLNVELSGEKITEEQYEEKIMTLGRATKRMFEDEKKSMIKQRVEFDKGEKVKYENFKTSALDSVKSLKETFPNFSNSDLDKVQDILIGDKINDIFYNSDGSLKTNSAEMVANAIYGEKMRKTIKELSMRKGESMANQRIVDMSPKGIKKNKSSQSSNGGLNVKAVSHLASTFDKDPYS